MSDIPHRFGFLLVPGFPLLSYAAAIEPLRGANLLAGKELYAWRQIGLSAAPVRSSLGPSITPDRQVGEAADCDTILVCAGGNPGQFRNEAAFAWLRAEARRGTRIGGISGGPYLLARAGLLDGHRCTVHWEHRPGFAEEFPQLDVRSTLYEIDPARLTCAGGIAALDMICAVIEADHGAALSGAVRDWFLQTSVRPAEEPQRRSLRDRYRTSQPRVLAALGRMETHLERPLPRERIAADVGVSLRQLERLFATHLGRSLGEIYLDLRLARARRLLRETSLPIVQVALACGFVSASHFSRAFAKAHGRPPRAARL